MSDIRFDSEHFIELTDLTVVNGRATVATVLKTLSRRGRCGLLVADSGMPQRYVNGNALAEAVVGAARLALDAGKLADVVLDDDVSGFIEKMSDVIQPILFAALPCDVAAPPATSAKTFYRVTADNQLIGVWSPQEVKEQAFTPQRRYRCTGPDKHPTTFYTDGMCTECPYPLQLE